MRQAVVALLLLGLGAPARGRQTTINGEAPASDLAAAVAVANDQAVVGGSVVEAAGQQFTVVKYQGTTELWRHAITQSPGRSDQLTVVRGSSDCSRPRCDTRCGTAS